jgi:two-component system invasion response regulator UvrY
MTDRTEILLIEDHPIVRDACRGLLERRADLVATEASTAQEGLDLNRRGRPGLVLLDLELPDAKGLDLVGRLRDENPHARVIVFTMHSSVACVAKALQSGAQGYVTKCDDPATILVAIDKVMEGATFLGPSVAQSVALAKIAPPSDPLGRLTAREREVIALLGEGKSLGEISATLEIGYKTAANVVSALKQKLEITTSAALVKFAVEHASRS